MTTTTQPQDLVSALADGQLSGDEFAAALQACHGNPEMRDQWSTYHLIGDVLRSPGLALADSGSHAFAARLAARLAQEPAPPSLPVLAFQPQGILLAPAVASRPAANDYRWKLVAGFASLAAVSAIAWSVSGMPAAPAAGPQLARQAGDEQVLVASPQGTMVRDARLEEMLAAHKQFGGTSALQVPSGFLRNATFETPQRASR